MNCKGMVNFWEKFIMPGLLYRGYLFVVKYINGVFERILIIYWWLE